MPLQSTLQGYDLKNKKIIADLDVNGCSTNVSMKNKIDKVENTPWDLMGSIVPR